MRQANRWSSVFGVAMLLLGAAFVSCPGGAVLADTSFSQIGADIDGEAANDWSGYSVAMSDDGSRVVIGTAGGPYGGGAGQVRVYSLTNGVWTQTGADFDGDAVGDALGRSVAMSDDGSRVAIGTSGGAGRVRVYTLTNGVWIQTGANIDGESAGDQSGWSVAMSANGSRVAIGARGNSDGGSNAGQVRVYTLTNGVWIQTGANIDGEAAYNWSGFSVAMSDDGSRVAVGATGAVGGAGRVRVYTLTNGAWIQTGANIDGEAANELSGSKVAMSADGSRVAIGAPQNEAAGANTGRVRVYTLTNGVWTQTGANFDGEAADNYLGRSVAMSDDGSRVAIGASENDGAGADAGRVLVYTLTNGVWIQTGANINGEAAGDNSGWSVAMSGDGSRVAIGAIFNDGAGADAGQVRVYEGVELMTTTTIAPATTTIGSVTTTVALATTTVAPPTTTVAPATTVVSPSVLPETGSQSDGWLIVGIFALILGTVLVTRRRKIG
jgi:LPXTG-motif cell wall-anchored protein